jgi:hypothetical protein
MKSNISTVPALPMEVWLPSVGLPYLKLHPDFPETVTVEPFSLETEGYLMGNSTSHDKRKFITGRVAKLPPGFNVGELVVADQFLILAVARALTYGETYTFRCQCPNCDVTETINIKVPEQLPVKVWSRLNPPAMEVTLPNGGDKVGLKLITVNEDGAVNKFIRDLRSAGGAVSEASVAYVRRMAHHLASVNFTDIVNIDEAEQYMRMLVGPNMVAFSEAVEDQSCGIDYTWWISCDKCGFAYDRSIPIVGDFFRGNRSRRPDPATSPKVAPLNPPPDGQPAVHA